MIALNFLSRRVKKILWKQTPKGKNVVRLASLRANIANKLKVLAAYGKACRCGVTDFRILSVDHINGDAVSHSKKFNYKRRHLYSWLIKNKFPAGFQILCMNCQFIKRHENHEW